MRDWSPGIDVVPESFGAPAELHGSVMTFYRANGAVLSLFEMDSLRTEETQVPDS